MPILGQPPRMEEEKVCRDSCQEGSPLRRENVMNPEKPDSLSGAYRGEAIAVASITATPSLFGVKKW
jgi:hypothetical protein